MSYIAVATNTALLGVDQDLNTPGYQGPFSYVEDKFGIDFGIELSFAALFFVEHGLVALKSWISYLLPPRGGLLSQVVQDGRITSVGESSTEASSSGYETTGTAKGNIIMNARKSAAAEKIIGTKQPLENAGKAAFLPAESKLLDVFAEENISEEARSQLQRVLNSFSRRLELAERMRDEAIAWAADVVPSETIASHFSSAMLNKKDN